MPTYEYLCDEHGSQPFEAFVPMDERDGQACPECGKPARRLLSAPMVMNHALPDGSGRFKELREQIKLDRARKWSLDKGEKKKINNELSKFKKKEA